MEKSIREFFGLIAADCCLSENNHLRKSPRNYTDPESVISLHKVRLPVAKDKLSITGFFKKKSKHSKNMSFVQSPTSLPKNSQDVRKSCTNSSFSNCDQTPQTKFAIVKEQVQETNKNIGSTTAQHKSTLTQTTVATKNFNSVISEPKNNRVSIRLLETQKEKQKKVSDPQKENKPAEQQQAKEEGSVGTHTDGEDQFLTKFRLTESVYDDSYQSSQFSKRGSVVEFSLRQMPRFNFKTDVQLSSSVSDKINTVRTCSFKQPGMVSTSRDNDTDKYSEVQYSLKVMPEIVERPAQMEESKFRRQAQSSDEVLDKLDS